MKSIENIERALDLFIGTSTGKYPAALDAVDRANLRLMSLALAWVLDDPSGGDMFQTTLARLEHQLHLAGLQIGEAACDVPAPVEG
jgi:hypothetical protein